MLSPFRGKWSARTDRGLGIYNFFLLSCPFRPYRAPSPQAGTASKAGTLVFFYRSIFTASVEGIGRDSISKHCLRKWERYVLLLVDF